MSVRGEESAWTTRARFDSWLPWLPAALLALPFARAIAAIHALPIDHDTPVMLYSGFLMSQLDWVPYRDFFEMNAPGALALYAHYYEAFGLDDGAYRVAHMGFVATMLGGIVFWFRGLGLAAGTTAAMAYAIAYADMGAWCAFQRDFIVCVPLLLALILALPGVGRTQLAKISRASLLARALAIGFAFGGAATIKPPIAIGLPITLLGLVAFASDGPLRHAWTSRSAALSIITASLGFLLIPGWLALELARQDALAPFLDMARNYWPLYSEIAGNGHLIGESQEAYLIEQTTKRVLDYPFLLAALIGFAAASFAPSMRRRGDRVAIFVLLGCVAAYIYSIHASGKTWLYHAHPLYLVLSLGVGFIPSIAARVEPRPAGYVRLGLVTIAALSMFRAEPTLPEPSNRAAAGAMVEHLERNLREGDEVLSLDVTLGALDAMLQTQTPSASRFLYSFHFYHHVGHPYIEALRAQFLREFDETPPRFVIQSRGAWHPRGRRGPVKFEALDARLERDYRRVATHIESRLVSLSLYERVAPVARVAPKNLLVVTVDTLRADHVSHLGHPRKTTPSIDAVAEAGHVFTRATTPIARTTPALASLFSGRYPHGTGVRRLFDSLAPVVTPLAEIAKWNGAETIAVVSNHILTRERGLDRGFELYDPASDHRSAAETTAAALSAMRSTGSDRPIMAWVHYIDPHAPYMPRPETIDDFLPPYEGRYARRFGMENGGTGDNAYPADLPKTEAVYRNPLPADVNERVAQLYAGDIRDTDEAIGQLLSALRAEFGDDWTIVITSDHGESLSERNFYRYDHGDYVYDASARIPLVIQLPEGHPQGTHRVIDDWVSLVDLTPTLVELMEWNVSPEVAKGFEGRSLVPYLRGEATEPRAVFSESGKSFHPEFIRGRSQFGIRGRFRAIWKGDWKLIWTPEPREGHPEFQLFDIRNDPSEQKDLAAAHPERAEALRTELMGWVRLPRNARADREPSSSQLEQLRSLGYVE